uniref:Uncharacterized protein n=1 Tax=Candidatus Nitrotoga fabula TaxID=2182327 RepID=A0A2X0QTS4_9PROT|nr:protein of unknown function [Candidatus Nitrotoga fabula]
MDTIKKQTTAPEWGTLPGELPKEFTDQMGKDLKDALHVRECGPGPDIEAIRWAYDKIKSNQQIIFGIHVRAEPQIMLDRLKAMLPENQTSPPRMDCKDCKFHYMAHPDIPPVCRNEFVNKDNNLFNLTKSETSRFGKPCTVSRCIGYCGPEGKFFEKLTAIE